MSKYIYVGVLLLVASAQAQQMCLSSDTTPRTDGAVTFDVVSTLGTSTIEESLVDVSLANTTGEIKIKVPPRGPANYFYLLVTASQKPRNSYDRKARLFLMVNGKVPLRNAVYFTHFTSSGRRATTNSLRVVGITNELPILPLGMMEFSEEEVTFEAMEFIHHGDSLR